MTKLFNLIFSFLVLITLVSVCSGQQQFMAGGHNTTPTVFVSYMDGTDNYLGSASLTTLNPVAMTFNIWAYIYSNPGAYGTIYEQGTTGIPTILLDPSGKILDAVAGGGGISYAGQSIKPSLNAWHMFTLTYNNVVGAQSYIDGIADGPPGTPEGFAVIASGPIVLGGNYPCCGYRYMNQLMSTASMYSVALTQAEVTTLYNGGSPAEPLIGLWPLNEGVGPTAYDYSSNHNNLTWYGTASGTFNYYNCISPFIP